MALTEKQWRTAITTAVLAPVTDNSIGQVARLVRTVPDVRWLDRHLKLRRWFSTNKDEIIVWSTRNNVLPTTAPKVRRGRFGTSTHSSRIRRDHAK